MWNNSISTVSSILAAVSLSLRDVRDFSRYSNLRSQSTECSRLTHGQIQSINKVLLFRNLFVWCVNRRLSFYSGLPIRFGFFLQLMESSTDGTTVLCIPIRTNHNTGRISFSAFLQPLKIQMNYDYHAWILGSYSSRALIKISCFVRHSLFFFCFP